MRNWFTADLHLGHDRIRKYCNRPFSSLEKMNETIIRNWNQRVKPDDIVFHVGDFCFRSASGEKEGDIYKAKHYVKQLNGNIVFLQGNHDLNNTLKTPIESLVVKTGGYRTKLIHHPEFAESKFSYNFCGHVHQNYKFKTVVDGMKLIKIINVGVDVNRFMPISFDEATKGFNKWVKGGE